MFGLVAVPFIIVAYFVGKRLRTNGQRVTIRQTASIAGIGLLGTGFAYSLLHGDGIAVAAVFGVVLGLLATIGSALLMLVFNTIRGKDSDRYQRW